MKKVRSILTILGCFVLLLNLSSCVIVHDKGHDRGKHKGWNKNRNNPHNPNTTNPGHTKPKGKPNGKK